MSCTSIRVLHVLYNYVPDKTGSTTRSRGLIAGQIANGIDAEIITSPFQPGMQLGHAMELVDGTIVHRTSDDTNLTIDEEYKGLLVRLRKLLSIWKFTRRIRKLCKGNGYDIVHAHSHFFCYMSAALAVIGMRVPVVYEVRSLWYERFDRKHKLQFLSYKVASAIEGIAARRADQLVVINQGLAEHYVKIEVPRDRIAIIENAVEDSLLRRGRQMRLRSSNDEFAFAYAGNLSSIEGLDILLQAFVDEFSRSEPVRLLYWGRGAKSAPLERKIIESADSRIEFRGEFGRDDLEAVYGSFDIAVMPRRNSLLTQTVTPLKPLEALAFGKGIILSDVAGNVEVVNGFLGARLFNAGCVNALQGEMRSAYQNMSNYRSSEYASSAKGFVAAHRSWNVVAKKYATIYEQLVTK